MQLIVDANILIAAFLKSALTRELLFDEKVELFAPEYFVIEVSRTIKKNKILRKYIKLTREETEELLNFLEVPLDDAPYLALSLFILPMD